MKNLVILVLVIAGAWFVWKKLGNFSPSSSSSSSSPASATESAVRECIGLAERASSEISSAASLVGRPPVDPSAWRSAESSASSAISAAESRCGSGSTEAERRAIAEVRSACSAMRNLLSGLSSAAAGSGGATDAPRLLEEVQQHLDAARAALP